MIEVIKYGTRKEITCPKCGSLLAYTAEDVQISGDYTLPNRYCIDCPVCNKEIIVPDKCEKGANNENTNR
ncbi:MAG: hypothetical protein IK093_17740 [Ruminiclostridium sp.]|nr:hypothetical protein [Ruminiclostridium sp.]